MSGSNRRVGCLSAGLTLGLTIPTVETQGTTGLVFTIPEDPLVPLAKAFDWVSSGETNQRQEDEED